VTFLLFAAVTTAWGLTLKRAPKEHVQLIHWLMLLLAVLKSLTVLGQVRACVCGGGGVMACQGCARACMCACA
jgi:hypothetical protein